MGRYASHKGHVILPLGDGWTVPDFMDPTEPPVSVTIAKYIIDQREFEGEEPRELTSVTFDAPIVGTSGPGIGINVGQAASALGVGRGDRVRITMRRIEERYRSRVRPF